MTLKNTIRKTIDISSYKLLSCPKGCGQGLDISEQICFEGAEATLICPNCHAKFPVCEGIPILFPDEKRNRISIGNEPKKIHPAKTGKNTICASGKAAFLWTFLKSRLSGLKQLLLNYSTPQHYYLQKFIRDFSKKSGPVSLLIDIGCGHSPFSEKFSYKNRLLVDIQKNYDVSILSDVQFLGLKDDCADLVLFTEVLEHVEDERKALAQIHRVLRAGGWLILTVPFLFGIHESNDYRRWTAQGIKKLLQQHGFVVSDFRCRGGCFSSLVCLWRNTPKELLGGNFQSIVAKVLLPVLVLHFLFCLTLTPLAVLLDRFDRQKLSSAGYMVLCRKSQG